MNDPTKMIVAYDKAQRQNIQWYKEENDELRKIIAAIIMRHGKDGKIAVYDRDLMMLRNSSVLSFHKDKMHRITEITLEKI